MVGYFVNTAGVLRADLEADPPFAALLERLARRRPGGAGAPDMPFPVLVERLPPGARPGALAAVPGRLRARAARTGGRSWRRFALGEAGAGQPGRTRPRSRGGRAARRSVRPHADRRPLQRRPARHRAALQYSPTCSTRRPRRPASGGPVRDPARRAVAEDPRRPVSELPLLTAPEGTRPPCGWNDTAAVYRRGAGAAATTLHGLIAAQAARTPGRRGGAGRGDRLTYRELAARGRRPRPPPARPGVGLGEVVAVALSARST